MRALRWIMGMLLSLGPFAVAGCCAIRQAPTPPQREASERPYPVVYAVTPPTLDGKLDDEVWQKAARVAPLYEFGKYGRRADVVTAYLAWDRDNLYLAVEIEDKDLFVASREHDGPLWAADAAELFIKPCRDRLDLYEFGFNMSGAVYDVHYIGRGGAPTVDRFIKYESGAIAKCSYEGTVNDWDDVDRGWSGELAIPLKAFRRAVPDGPRPGERWRFNLAGYDWSCYREDVLMFTSCDGNLDRFSDYELYPEMEFMASEAPR